jgi:hypothetical protein
MPNHVTFSYRSLHHVKLAEALLHTQRAALLSPAYTPLRSNIMVETDTGTRGRGDAQKNESATYEYNLV